MHAASVLYTGVQSFSGEMGSMHSLVKQSPTYTLPSTNSSSMSDKTL
jgi:hypothetical protein